MATPGANLVQRGREKIHFGINRALGLLPNAKIGAQRQGDDPTATPRNVQLHSKNGTPASSTAADAPSGKGDLCLNTSVTPHTLYRCSAYTDGTTFTWTQIA